MFDSFIYFVTPFIYIGKERKILLFFGIIRKRYEIRAEYIKKIVDLHKKSLKIYCQIEEKSVKYRKKYLRKSH